MKFDNTYNKNRVLNACRPQRPLRSVYSIYTCVVYKCYRFSVFHSAVTVAVGDFLFAILFIKLLVF